MRLPIIPTLMLMLGAPAAGQTVQAAQPEAVQARTVDPARARTDAPVVNPTTMQLRVQIGELSAKVDELTSLIQAQGNMLAAIDGNLSALRTSVTQFRQVSDEQYNKLRMTGFLDCYQTAANSTWGYGDGDVAIKHCTGELGPADKVPL